MTTYFDMRAALLEVAMFTLVSEAALRWTAQHEAIAGYSAEDLFQDGMVKLLEHLPTVREGDAVMQRAFLKQRVVGAMRDAKRTWQGAYCQGARNDPNRRRFPAFVSFDTQRHASPSYEDQCIAEDDRYLLRVLVRQLPAQEHEVIRQLFFAEQSAAEVAAALQVCESRVYQIRVRAMQRLQAWARAARSRPSARP